MLTQISKSVQRTGGNILKTGVILLIANVANQTLRYTAKDTMEDLAKDYRRFRTTLEDKREMKHQTA